MMLVVLNTIMRMIFYLLILLNNLVDMLNLLRLHVFHKSIAHHTILKFRDNHLVLFLQ